jgi:fibronectin-binding autotransporter adhesin
MIALRRFLRIPCLPVLVATCFCVPHSAVAQEPGIIVSPSGVLLKDGMPYRSIGGNVPFDSEQFFEYNNARYPQTFAEMKEGGLTTIRLSTKGWYAAWKLSYLSITDKEAYFEKMDAIVNAAAENDVGVILLLCWWVSAVSDYYGEPEIAATIPGSKTYVAMAQFATDMAEHYKDNPAVVGYDMINEMNLLPDQPNSGQSVTGRWTAEGIQVMYANMSGAIRAVDPKRLLSTGATDARGNQFHFSNYCTWNLDTPAQIANENAMAHPDPAGVLGIHYYPDSALLSYGTNWEVYNALSRKIRKPFYAGEFGNGDGNKPPQQRATNFNIALESLIANRVPLMSQWYIGSPQFAGGDTAGPTGSLAFAWNAMVQAAAQYHYGPWESLSVTTGDWNSTGSWASGDTPTTADDAYVPTDTTARTLTIANTAYARNLAVGNASTSDQAATIQISGSGQLVLGQDSTITFDTTSDEITPTTYTVEGAHGQLLDSSSRSAILSINQSAGETKPAIVANTVSAYRMTSGARANITAATVELNLFDGLAVGAGSVQQTGGIVRVGLDANLAGGTPAGLALGTGTGSPKYLLSNGTLAASGITGTTAAINWQGGTISTLDGASMSVGSGVDLQLSASGTHTLRVADADQSMTLNATAKISGSGNLTKSGPGKLVFPASITQYTYTGTTTVSDGILQVKNQNALPGWNTAGKVSVAARVANAPDGTVSAGTVAFNVGGAGEWTTTNIGTILGTTGRITFGEGSSLGIDTSNATSNVTLTSRITGSKGITKLGNGTLILNPSTGGNDFTGMTTVMGGTLRLGTTTNTIIAAASGFDVQGGTLDLGGKSITLNASFQATTAHPEPALFWAPFLTQPSRVTFAGGTVQSGTIVNNTVASGFESIYDAQSGTVSANLAGTVMLWKTTPGTLTLTGNNSYTGGTRICKGTLIFGHANALGTSGNIQFMNGTLKYATGVTTDLSARFKYGYSAINIDTNGQIITFESPIDSTNGSGLKKSGAGTLILKAANNAYTGGTWIDEGTLQTDVDGALSATAANNLTVRNGGTLDLNGTTQTIGILDSMGDETVSIVNNKDDTQATLNINGSGKRQFGGTFSDHATGTGTLGLNIVGTGEQVLYGSNITYTGTTVISSGTLTLKDTSDFTGSITNNATLNLAASEDTNYLFAGSISGSGSVRASGPGTVTLSGDYAYGGITTLSGGILEVAHLSDYGAPGSLGNRSADDLHGVGILFRGGTLQYNGSTAQSTNRAVRVGTSGGGATFDASGSNPAATLSFTAASSPNFLEDGGNRKLTFTGSNIGNNTFAMAIGQWVGLTSVVKDGPGTWVLAGNSTYTGTTNVNAGTLKVTGSLNAGSTVTVLSSATLMGNGAARGSVAIGAGATIAPGNSAGTLSTGSTTLDGTYACEIDGATADRISSTGDLTINSSAALAISILNAPTVNSYVIASWGGTLTGTFVNVTGKPNGYALIYDAVLKQIRLEINNAWTGAVNSNWDATTANWTLPSIWASGAVASFGTGIHSLNVLGNVQVFNITGLDGNDSIQIGTGNSLQILSANLPATWVKITGSGALSIGGEGTSTLGAASTFSGTLTSTGGTVSMASLNSALALVMNGGGFTYTGGSASLASLAVNQAGTLTVPSGLISVGTLTGSGALSVKGSNWATGLTLAGTANNGFSGTINIGTIGSYGMLYLAHENLLGTNANALIMSGSYLYDNGSPLTIANHKITVNGGMVFAANNSSGDMNITGGITGSGGVTIRSQTSRAVVIGGSNNYSDNTSVYTDGGNSTLRLGANNVLPFGTGKGNLSLTAWSVGTAKLDLGGYSQTINGLSDSGGGSGGKIIDNVSAGGSVTLTVGDANALGAFSGSIRNTSGTLHLEKIGTNTLTLSGSNTYTGNTTVSAGTFTLADNARLKFITGAASGVNNRITGAGTAIINGDFVIDTSATDASTLASGSWQIDSLAARPYGSTFTVVDWTDAGSNKWTKTVGTKDYTFDESTGVVTLKTSFTNWIAALGLSGANAAFAADPDRDGIPNGLELVLGGEPNPARPNSNSSGLLPGVAGSSGDLIFSFNRKVVSQSGVVLTFQWSTNLNFASQANDIPVGVGSSATNGVNVAITQGVPDSLTDRVVVTVPAAKAVSGKLFGRLKAVQIP